MRSPACRKARWCCRGSIPISTTMPGRRSAASGTRRANSPRRRHRTIRNSRCTRCWTGSASSAATSRFSARRRRMDARCWCPRRCGHRPRPRNGMTGWNSPRYRAKISGGMTNLAVVEAPNPEMEALAIAVAMREARHLGKSAALVTPDRALARRVMAALEPLESRIRRFRRRRADGHAGRNFRAAGGRGRGEGAGAADLAGAAEASVVPARRRARRVDARHRSARTGAVARHAAAGGKRRPRARFRSLPRRTAKTPNGGEISSLHAPNRAPDCGTKISIRPRR